MFPLQRLHMGKLKCSKCEKFLSVPPIYMNQGTFICGRCKPSGLRVTIYEELAKYMSFPCSHELCTEQLSFKEARKHELNCPFKLVGCPKHHCDHYCMAKDLYDHFKFYHNAFIGANDFTKKRRLRDMPIGQFNDDLNVYLIYHECEPYLLMVHGTCKEDEYNPGFIESYVYSYGVFYLYQSTKTKTHYNLTVDISDQDDAVTEFSWLCQPVKQYNHLKHCLKCLSNNCSVHHIQRNILGHTINILNESDLVVTFNLTLADLPSPVDVSVSSELECPVCYEYLSSPIYLCKGGHSICSTCKKKCKKCSLCNALIGNCRNYTLEKISENLVISCLHASKGCKMTGKIKDINLHTTNCIYN